MGASIHKIQKAKIDGILLRNMGFRDGMQGQIFKMLNHSIYGSILSA